MAGIDVVTEMISAERRAPSRTSFFLITAPIPAFGPPSLVRKTCNIDIQFG